MTADDKMTKPTSTCMALDKTLNTLLLQEKITEIYNVKMGICKELLLTAKTEFTWHIFQPSAAFLSLTPSPLVQLVNGTLLWMLTAKWVRAFAYASKKKITSRKACTAEICSHGYWRKGGEHSTTDSYFLNSNTSQ